MTCAACARTIERKLGKTAGVDRASVNFATSSTAAPGPELHPRAFAASAASSRRASGASAKIIPFLL